ncbi:MAG: enoyl-CoA hydratase/isomerase family protein [Paracoccaceae bacterium]
MRRCWRRWTIWKGKAMSVSSCCQGRGRAFSAGADLKFMGGLSGAALRRFIEASHAPAVRLEQSGLISIAALEGHVLGGGAELALACDMRIAGPGLNFGFPEMVLGSLPGSGGMQRLPALVGRARALEMVTLGRRVGAEEARALGLVLETAADPVARALALAAAIAERPAESLRYAKVALRLADDPVAAGAFHGLVSALRQADPDYRQNRRRITRED